MKLIVIQFLERGPPNACPRWESIKGINIASINNNKSTWILVPFGKPVCDTVKHLRSAMSFWYSRNFLVVSLRLSHRYVISKALRYGDVIVGLLFFLNDYCVISGGETSLIRLGQTSGYCSKACLHWFDGERCVALLWIHYESLVQPTVSLKKLEH